MRRTLPYRLLTGVLVMLFAAAILAPGARAVVYQDAAAPEVTVTLDRTRVTVGDPIALTVAIKHAIGITIQTTSIDDQLGLLEPLSSEPPEERASGSGMELRLRYKVAVYHTGDAELPVLTFTYALPDGSQQQVSSKAAVPITVQSVLPDGADPTDIRPLKAQASLPAPASELLIWVAGIGGIVLALAAVGALSYLLLRRSRRPTLVPVPTAVDVARAELDQIMAARLLEKGELIEHYRRLAICIRRYLTDRFGFAAVALTTGELERQMEARGIATWPARLISGLLSECDAVTYARYVPASARSEAHSAIAYEILDETESAGVRPVVQAV